MRRYFIKEGVHDDPSTSKVVFVIGLIAFFSGNLPAFQIDS